MTIFMQPRSRNGPAWSRWTRRPLDAHEFQLKPTAELPDPHNAMMQEVKVPLFAPAFHAFLARTRG